MTTPNSADLFQRLTELTDQQLADPAFTLDQLAQQLSMSRSTLARLVKQQTGLSLSHFVRQRRLLMARQLLETTELRIVEIADQVGFATSQELSRYFAQAFGASPSEFRKMPDAVDRSPLRVDSVADTDTLPANKQSGEGEPVPVAKPARNWTNGLLLLFGLIVVGVLGWAFFADWQHEPATTLTMAVLPFQVQGPDSTSYYSDGVSEELEELLTQVDSLKLMSHRAMLEYAHTTKPLSQIAQELGVHYLITGRVRKQENQVNVSLELVVGASNQTLWRHRYEGNPKQALGFMNDAARQVATRLHQSFRPGINPSAQSFTQNPDAYNAYLKGHYLLRSRTKPNLDASLVQFNKAIALDSTFAEAYAGRAQNYYLFTSEGYLPETPSLNKAETNALKAIRLDPENGQAYATLANLYRARNQWEQAITTYQIALRFRPKDALINYWYSISLRSLGRYEEAIRYSSQAVKLDPLHPVILIGHICNLSYAHRFREAEEAIKEGQPLYNQIPSWYWATGFYYVNKKQFDRALTEFTKAYRLNRLTDAYPTLMGYCQARLGHAAAARAVLDSLPSKPETLPHRAILYAGLGDTEHCLQMLEQGAQTGHLPDYLKVSPLFVGLQTNPRFQAVLQRVGL